jgi:lysophospholipase L1-like esterase
MKKLLIFICLLLPAIGVAQAPTATATPTYDELKARMQRFEARLTDWPNLKRYSEANSKLSPPMKGEHRVVFMGDSITDGWKLEEYFPGKPYVNRGISGQTTPQMLVRFQPDVIALRPRVVVILAGTNDIAGNTGPMTLEAIENNYRSMAELAKAHGIKVIFSSILPISDYNKNAQGQPIVRSLQRKPEQILALNKWLKDYAAANKHIYLDYFAATADDKGFLRADLANDGLHPHAGGYKIMAPLAQKAIDEALRK